jgi:general secretion pathway protein D
MRFRDKIFLCVAGGMLAGCGTNPIQPSEQHMQRPASAVEPTGGTPQPIKGSVLLQPPKPAGKIATYSVVVANVPAQEILFALARDAKINLDIQAGIQGTVTINAIDQTLPQILTRIARQVDMRYELDNGTLTVMPDKPFLRTYNIDFINISRSAKSTNSTSSQITGGGAGSTGASGGNSASTLVSSDTQNDLMGSLIKNVTDILLEEDRLRFKSQKEVASSTRVAAQGDGAAQSYTGAPPGSGGKGKSGGETGPAGGASGAGNQTVSASGAATSTIGEFEKSVSVFANKETGVLIVRATSRQHEKVQEFVDKVMTAAKRQVLIEATIVEVQLSDNYKQGIDWTQLRLGAKGLALSQAGTAGLAATTGALAVSYINPTSRLGNIAASVQLLEKFGNVKVLSSPKLTVMNNQTASLKVADSKVYFTVKADIIAATATTAASASYSTTANSVSVGLTMSVTPQISDTDTVTINVRPSISSLIGLGVKDPNPVLANPCGSGVTGCTIPAIENRIPEIQTREMESIIKIENGQTAVMGGLIKEEINKNTSEIPLLGRLPIVGNLFQNRDDTTTKTELVIFLRPVVIKNADVNSDFKEFRSTLPDQNFFNESASGKP